MLLIAFGSLLAMGLPIITAILGIGAGLSLIELLGHLYPAPSFSPIIASLIGLGVGVDYALFIVTRFRESLQAGVTPQDAAVTAMRTAGRTVLVAGTTVVIGMLGLLVLRQPLLNGVAVAAAATVATTLLGSLTLLPAMLGFTGTRLARHARVRLPRRRRAARDSRPAKRPAAERWAGLIQGVLDTLGGLACRQPLLVPLAGQPGTVALLTTPDALDGDRALNPDNRYPEWQQEVAARSALRIGLYRPGRSASRVRCPLLVLVCDQDQSALAGPAARAAKRAPSGELVRMPGGHYEPFLGGHEQAAEAELSFLRRHLLNLVGEASLPSAPAASRAVPGAHGRG